MSQLAYARLLVALYQFPESKLITIAGILKKEDESTILTTIENLVDKPSGSRLKIIIKYYFGIDGKRMKLREIANLLEPAVSNGRVQQLYQKALRNMRTEFCLQPLLLRILSYDIKGNGENVEETLRLPPPDQVEILRTAVAEDFGWENFLVSTANFSARTRNCLAKDNVHTFGELCALSPAELLRKQNFGRKALIEVEKFLTSIGQKLRSPE